MAFVEYLLVALVDLGRYPSQCRPVFVQRRHAGFASSHLTLRSLLVRQSWLYSRTPSSGRGRHMDSLAGDAAGAKLLGPLSAIASGLG